jgi:hypothetical protein
MRGAVLHAKGDVRYEERPDPVTIEPTCQVWPRSTDVGAGLDAAGGQ